MPRTPPSRLTDRRTLLKRAGAALAVPTAAWFTSTTARAQQTEPDVERLSPRINVVRGLGGNIVVHSDENAQIVVDSGAGEQTQTVVTTVQYLTASNPLTAVFNTHWHRDQVGGNARLANLGADIIAHVRTHAHLAVAHYRPEDDRYAAPLPAAAHPTETFYTDGELSAGRRRIRYGHLLEAHTDGDAYVLFEDDNVIAAGDAISPLRDPAFDWFGGGWLGGRIDSLELLLELGDSETRYVPSYGFVADRAYVESELELMLGLYDIMFDRVRAGDSAADIYASGALDALPRRFEDPRQLLYAVHKGIWAHHNTISPDIV